MTRINNWGRWGRDDTRGAVNLITPEVVRLAAALVRQGVIYSLALPIRRSGVPVAPGRNPSLHLMALDGGDYAAGRHQIDGTEGADDYIFMSTSGTTHIDALAHVWYDGQMYNGFSGKLVRSIGARQCGVDRIVSIFTRGLLADIAGFKGVPYLPKGYVISAEELEACLAQRGLFVRPGDVLLIRTGWLSRFTEDPDEFYSGEPGIGLAAAEWLAAKDVVAIGSDNLGVEALPASGFVPVHKFLVRDCGIYLMELFDLDVLARDGVWEFLFVAAPLRIIGGAASPLNPLAIA